MTAEKDKAVAGEIAALETLNRDTLVDRWRAAFGHAPPPRLSRPLMVKALAYEIQVKAYGGLSSRTARVLKAAARPTAGDTAASHAPAIGARLVREWNGVLHEVEVLAEGYLWRGERHRSLSAIARAITGTKWSGPRFFGVGSGAR
jgi:hypothetical protein